MVGNPTPVGYNNNSKDPNHYNDPNYYTVKDGDCLWDIAMREVMRENPSLQGDDLTKATAQELQLIEQANPKIGEKGGRGFDLIWAGDKIDIPNRPQIPGVAPQAGATRTVAVYGGQHGMEIPTGTVLKPGDSYTSPNGQYTLKMENEGPNKGSLVLYKNNPNGKPTLVFETGTYTGNPYKLGVGDHAVIQADGNLVVYDSDGKAVWSSNTSSTGDPGGDPDAGGAHRIPSDANAVLAIQDDGNIVIYTDGGKFAAWDALHHHNGTRLGGDKQNGDPNSGSTV
jgi:hypothetical protein